MKVFLKENTKKAERDSGKRDQTVTKRQRIGEAYVIKLEM